MRMLERAARRADLPLRYSQGFNPRPQLSLLPPRPVGVATRGDLLTLRLDGEVDPVELPRRMNEQAPEGLSFLRAEALACRAGPRAQCQEFCTSLTPPEASAASRRVEELRGQGAWPVQREVASGGRRRPKMRTAKAIDLRPLVRELRVEGRRLAFVLQPQGDVWARPAEVLRILGLDEALHLAATVRVATDFGLLRPTGAGGDG